MTLIINGCELEPDEETCSQQSEDDFEQQYEDFMKTEGWYYKVVSDESSQQSPTKNKTKEQIEVEEQERKELEAVMQMIEEKSKGKQRYEGYPSYSHFFPGLEADPLEASEPCEQNFLVALVVDLAYWMYRAVHEFVNVTDLEKELSSEIELIARFLLDAMDQCKRLQSNPRLFPSKLKKKMFLRFVADIVACFSEVRNAFDKQHIFNSAPHGRVESRTDRASSSFQIRQNEEAEQVLPFEPDKSAGRYPWNIWLDNSAIKIPNWIAVQQRIPRYGDKINRRITLAYDAVERDLAEIDGIVRDPEVETPNIPQPGDSFTHMIWSGFATHHVHNLGFVPGHRKTTEGHGRVTLESLARNVAEMGELTEVMERRPGIRYQPRRGRIWRQTKNSPFFRFAMAYRT